MAGDWQTAYCLMQTYFTDIDKADLYSTDFVNRDFRSSFDLIFKLYDHAKGRNPLAKLERGSELLPARRPAGEG